MGRRCPQRQIRSGRLLAHHRGDRQLAAPQRRSDDIIKSRGEKVAPKEVEEVLYAFEGVHEAVVLGAPDERLGEAVVAHVSACAGCELDPKTLRRHCAERLEEFMVPRRILVHDELPKTDNGKFDRLALSDLTAEAASVR